MSDKPEPLAPAPETGEKVPAVDIQAGAAGGQPAGSVGKVKTGASLWALGAALRAFLNIGLDFYPRLGAKARSLSSEDIVGQFVAEMGNWGGMPASTTTTTKTSTDGSTTTKTETTTAIDLATAISLAKASLDEVKSQTEYQDQKATRLLTVTTLLTALAGAFFTNFAGDFPLRTLSKVDGGDHWLLVATYTAFVLFVMFALTGSLVTFHATRTRFKYPGEATVGKQDGPTRSFLFYREIIGVTPKGWAGSFVTGSGSDAKLNPALQAEYLKNYVSEAYLIAAKTADKLRYLQPAQSLLAFALRCLIVYVVLLAMVAATLEPTKPAPQPTIVRVADPTAPLPVKLEPTPRPSTTPGPRGGSPQ